MSHLENNAGPIDRITPAVPVGQQLQDVLRLVCSTRQPFLLIGGTGVGKSESVEAFARSERMQPLVMDLSLMEAPDLLGLPSIEGGVTRYNPPSILPRDPDSKGILMFEELNRAPAHVRAPCLQLLTARRLNEYVLPAGWTIGAAINHGDEYCDTHELDPALLVRFCKIKVRVDHMSWLSWAKNNGVHQAVISFVKNNETIFEGDIESNPRSWTNVSKIINRFTSHYRPDDALRYVVAGLVGDDLAEAFIQHFSTPQDEMPEIQELLREYSTIYREVVARWVANGDTVRLNELANAILFHLQDPDREEGLKNDRIALGQLRKVVRSLPADFRTRILNEHTWIEAK